MGPKVVAGSFSSRATRPAKCTSPAKANVMSPVAATGRRCLTIALAPAAARFGAWGPGALLEQAAVSAIRAVMISRRRVTAALAYVRLISRGQVGAGRPAA